ncbi:MAG: response regulator [Spirochaetales bacterium]|nr:response regulator [Spirochaetales bacterium]
MTEKKSIKAKIQRAFIVVCLIALVSCNLVMIFSLVMIKGVSLENSSNINTIASNSSAQSLLEQALKSTSELVQAKSDVIDKELKEAAAGVEMLKGYIEWIYGSPRDFRPRPVPNYRAVPPGELALHWFLEFGKISGARFDESDLVRAGVLRETQLLGNMERVCALVMKNIPDIFTIFILTKSGQNVHFDKDAARKGQLSEPILQRRPWYINARDRNALYISDAYYDSAGRGLTVSMSLPYHGRNGDFLGVVGIDIKIDDLDRSIQKTVVSKSGYAILLNNNAGQSRNETRFVAAPGLSEKSADDFQAYLGTETKQILTDMRSMHNGIGYSTLRLGGENTIVYVIWGQISLTDWHLIYVIPESEILTPSVALRREISSVAEDAEENVSSLIFKTLVASILLLFSITLATFRAAFFIARRIASPITTLTQDVKKLGPGNLAYTSGIKTGDEIEELAVSFENMAKELKLMVEKDQQRAQELQKQTDIALKASRAKSEFLATMSHEIRTPLNAIIGLSEIELQENLAESSKNNLAQIFNSGSALLEIVNDILDISKIEAGSFELVPVEYETTALINDTVNLNRVRIGSRPISFVLELDGTFPRKLKGDELRVKQIFNNILSNAIKYTRKGIVTLCLHWEKLAGSALIRARIQDTGIGIREEDIGKLFSDYTQLDTRANRQIEGTGLGLAITRKLVEMMGGRISVESQYGAGSVFTVEIIQTLVDALPIGEETADSLKTFHYVNYGKNRDIVRAWMPYGKVLVVDDMPVNLQVARGFLAPYGLQIDTAASGKEAIEKIRREAPRYDLVFMDHMMPEIDGVETVRIIRSEIAGDYARELPIIALTANALAGVKEMFLTNGFSGYISKPIDIAQLDAALNVWVRNKQSTQTLMRAEKEKNARNAHTEKKNSRLLENRSIEGVDTVRGRQQYGGETAYVDILRAYLTHTPSILEKLRSPSRDDLCAYIVLIHGLKGSSYGICADTIGKKAAELEAAARAGDFEKITEENPAFLEAAQTLLLDIEKLLQGAPSGEKNRPRLPAPGQALLDKLLDAVKHYKTAAMEETLTELESYDYENNGGLVTWLRGQMDNLEYDAMRNRLESG